MNGTVAGVRRAAANVGSVVREQADGILPGARRASANVGSVARDQADGILPGARRVPANAGPGTGGEPAPAGPVREPRTAEQRWRAAVARQPLETPRAFPAAFRPLVAGLTAGSHVRYTTGPRTRAALAAAGALGATTGSTVHLSAPPDTRPSSMRVLAHELAHARRPVGRPRFLLGLSTGAADEEERAAQAVGNRVSAGVVDGLPVGGAGAAGVVDVATQAARNAVAEHAAEQVTEAGQAVNTVSEAAGEARATAEHAVTAAATTVAKGPSAADLDRIAEALEERVLRQLERRGGRYSGVF
ncbi:DUF4157 domain-containing protein [Amycolatopsis sp. NPDC021455]|uniref:eCIS core domain-containing protein n=1 Tax=Amycolatopsis sp. NPDC021455 TaxID=3154901 RepID=UPI0033D74047